MGTLADTAAKRWEMHHPVGLGAIAFAATLWRGADLFSYAASHNWKVDQLYTCVFTLSTVVTTFLLTFYTFVLTAERGFIGRAKNSRYFRLTVRYTLAAIVVGGVLSLATVPLLVVQPTPASADPWLIYVAAWAAATLWAGASFVRAAYLFAIFAGHDG